jgi:endonuclease/exonuclease/phosphatase family metal-dependent hydrolase
LAIPDGRIDAVKELVALLGTNYTCWTSSYYLKSAFLPQKDIMDAVGITVAIISRYELTGAVRYQLPTADKGFIRDFFYYKRCVLQVRLPVEGNEDLIVMNTHLDSKYIAQNTALNQLKKLASLDRQLDGLQMSWALCGDFRISSGTSAQPNRVEDLRFIETVLKETAMMPSIPTETTNTNGSVTAADWTREHFGFIFLSTNYSSVSNRLTFLASEGLSDAVPLVADILVR